MTLLRREGGETETTFLEATMSNFTAPFSCYELRSGDFAVMDSNGREVSLLVHRQPVCTQRLPWEDDGSVDPRVWFVGSNGFRWQWQAFEFACEEAVKDSDPCGWLEANCEVVEDDDTHDDTEGVMDWEAYLDEVSATL